MKVVLAYFLGYLKIILLSNYMYTMYICVCIYIYLLRYLFIILLFLNIYVLFTSLIYYYARINVLEDFCCKFSTSVMEQMLLWQHNY